MVAFLLGASQIYAGEEETKKLPISIAANAAINSKYIWRGFTMDDDPVMQSGASLGVYGFTAIVWGSFDIDESDGYDGDELDVTLDYTYKYKLISISAGHTWYWFPGIFGRSNEFYIGSAIDIPGSPSFTWYHDYGEEANGGGYGDYFVLSASHNFPLIEIWGSSLTFDLSAHIGYNHRLFIEGDGGDAAIGAGITLPLGKYASFSPNVNYSVPFGDLSRADDGGQKDKFYFGGKLVVVF